MTIDDSHTLMLTRKYCKCKKCSYEWMTTRRSQGRLPHVCPACHSPYWNDDYLYDIRRDEHGRKIKEDENGRETV